MQRLYLPALQRFLDYVVQGTNFPELREQLLREFNAGKELTGPKGLRRKLGAIDLEYFGRAYLAHYFVRKSPKFHGELDRIWREGVMKGLDPLGSAKEISRADGCRRAIEAPRGHAKSTTFTFKDDLHAAVYGYKHYIIILSDSSEQAEGFLVDLAHRVPGAQAAPHPAAERCPGNQHRRGSVGAQGFLLLLWRRLLLGLAAKTSSSPTRQRGPEPAPSSSASLKPPRRTG